MAKNVIFNMAATTILDFAGYEFRGQMLSRDLVLYVCIKFGAIRSKMAELLPFN